MADYIDTEYLNKVKLNKRKRQISEINNMLSDMSNEQVNNVYTYTSDEHDEPNHEAEALEVVVNLSKGLRTHNK